MENKDLCPYCRQQESEHQEETKTDLISEFGLFSLHPGRLLAREMFSEVQHIQNAESFSFELSIILE